MAVEVDESFKRPGAIPFKWEVQPGVPKGQQHPQTRPAYESYCHQSYSLPSTPHNKLTPQPWGPSFTPPPDFRSPSVRSVSSLHNDRHQFEPPLLATKHEVVSAKCFLGIPWLRWRRRKRRSLSKLKLESESDYTSELESLARSSMWTRKSRSPLYDSPSSSSFSSFMSSPRPLNDAEWAGFGLF